MKWNYISLYTGMRTATLLLNHFYHFYLFLLVLTTFADIETVTDRITRTVAPKSELV